MGRLKGKKTGPHPRYRRSPWHTGVSLPKPADLKDPEQMENLDQVKATKATVQTDHNRALEVSDGVCTDFIPGFRYEFHPPSNRFRCSYNRWWLRDDEWY